MGLTRLMRVSLTLCNLYILWQIIHRKSENVHLKFTQHSAILNYDNDNSKSMYKSFLQFSVSYLLQ